MQTKPLTLLIAGVVVAGSAWVGARPAPSRSPSPAAPSVAAAAAPPRAVTRPRATWPAGERSLYAIAWKTANVVRLGARDMVLDVDLEGEIALTGLAGEGDARRVKMELSRVDRAGVTIDGKSLYSDSAAAARDLTARSVAIEMDRDGTIQRLAVEDDPAGLFRHLARGILVELEVTAPPGDTASWTVIADGPSGLSRVAYTVQEDGAVVRRRTRYLRTTLLPASMGASPRDDEGEEGRPQSLESRAIVRFDGARLALIEDDERFAIATDGATLASAQSRFALHFVRADAAADAGALPASWQSAHDAHAPGALSHRLLVQRVDGLTLPRLLTDLRIFAGAGLIPEQTRWVWRATGLLLLEPEAARDLADLFTHPAMDVGARGLLLDLLASAGHGHAQAAMRRAVAWPGLDDADLAALVQRFSFVSAPEPATLELVVSLAEKETRSPAVLLTLGAVLGNARLRGDAVVGSRGHALLVRALAESTDDTRRPALAALGNAGFAADAASIRARASDRDEQIRSQVAWSLRKLDSAETRATLLALVADPSTSPAMAALQVLGTLDLSPDDRARLRAVRDRPTLDARVRTGIDALL